MTTAPDTIADRFLDRLLDGDGCRRRTARLRVSRIRLAARIGRPVRDDAGDIVGWRFADGSSLISCGDGWDTPEGWASHR